MSHYISKSKKDTDTETIDGFFVRNTKHLLCNGEQCGTGYRHCSAPCLVKKDTAKGLIKGNLTFVCCFIAKYLNEIGASKLPNKLKPNDKCPCGSGKKVKRCVWSDQRFCLDLLDLKNL